MQVSNNSNDSLSKEINLSNPYSKIFLILRKNSNNISDLYLLEKYLERICTEQSKKSFMNSVGDFLGSDLVNLIFKFYIKFKIDIPILNSILITHKFLGDYYKDGLKLCLLSNSQEEKFPEILSLKVIILNQFPDKNEINLSVYLDVLKIKGDIKLAVYNFKQQKYIYNSLFNFLNVKIKRDETTKWKGNNEVYF